MSIQKWADALGKGPGGIQINITDTGCTVSTRYRPFITKRAPTILEALQAVVDAGYQRFRPTEVAIAIHELERKS